MSIIARALFPQKETSHFASRAFSGPKQHPRMKTPKDLHLRQGPLGHSRRNKGRRQEDLSTPRFSKGATKTVIIIAVASRVRKATRSLLQKKQTTCSKKGSLQDTDNVQAPGRLTSRNTERRQKVFANEDRPKHATGH
jgi:hypothetical protein